MSRGVLLVAGIVVWQAAAFAVLLLGASTQTARLLVPLLGTLVNLCGIGALVLVGAAALTWLPIWRPPWVYEVSIWCIAVGLLLEFVAVGTAATVAVPAAGVLLALPVVVYVGYWLPPGRRRVLAELEDVVAAPRPAVFELATDPAAQPRLMPERSKPGEVIGGGPVRAGARLRGWARVGAVRVVGVDEVVEYTPPSRVAYRTLSGAPANLVVFAFDEVPAGTRIRYRSESVISIPSALLGGWRVPLAARRLVEYRSRWIDAIRRELKA